MIGIKEPSHNDLFCFLYIFMFYVSSTCSTFFILSMTFERFYSIIRPHKAASFNTVKKARITIICIFLFSVLYHVPYFKIAESNGRMCVYRNDWIYYSISIALRGLLPFLLLLVMNSIVIHNLRQRSRLFTIRSGVQGQNQGQNQNGGNKSKIKQSERQIYVILLFVAFAFIILVTPFYIYIFLLNFYKSDSPSYYSWLRLLRSVANSAMYTNCGINFFLYVISGQKFRTDLMKLLFCCKYERNTDSLHSATTVKYKNIYGDWPLIYFWTFAEMHSTDV